GVEIAAAALQLLEKERTAKPKAASAPAAHAPRERERDRGRDRGRDRERDRESGPMTPLFVNVGSRDNVRPGDLVGAIANEGGVTSADVGKIDVRESHSVVEVSSSVADTVIERVTGTPIRGRRAVVRRDEGRRAPERGGDERPPRRRDDRS